MKGRNQKKTSCWTSIPNHPFQGWRRKLPARNPPGNWRPNQPLPKIINALAHSQKSTNWKSSTTKKTVVRPNLTPFIYPCLRALTHSCAAAILISFSLNLFWRFLLRGLVDVNRMRIEAIYIGWFLQSNFWYGKSTAVKVWLQTTCNWQLMQDFSIKASWVSPYFVACSPLRHQKKTGRHHTAGAGKPFSIFSVMRSQKWLRKWSNRDCLVCSGSIAKSAYLWTWPHNSQIPNSTFVMLRVPGSSCRVFLGACI